MQRRWALPLGIVTLVVIVVVAAGALWLSDLADPMPEAEAALASDGQVTVTSDPWLTFTPTAPSPVGLVFYPGGRVPAAAYAPAARALAGAGYLTVVPSMPFGLAVLDSGAADAVIEAHPEVERWVIAGHSLGGAMAAAYADGHEAIDGLVLWAAYPPDGTDLSERDIEVASVYATEDGLTTIDEVRASAAQLPPDTAFTAVEGGNHAGFGWYGPQDGDGEATISRAEQQAQAVEATLALLAAVEAG